MDIPMKLSMFLMTVCPKPAQSDVVYGGEI
jgi:hypothetical protein